MKSLRLILLIYFALLFTPAIALSQNCDQTVVDGSGVFKDRISEVEAAANELAKLGADVKIRTYQNIGDAGNLVNYITKVQSDCASWKNNLGGKKENLIIIAHSRAEKMAVILSGSDWKNQVDANYNRIITQIMRPHFRQDNHAQAFINATIELKKLLTSQAEPETSKENATTNASSNFWGQLLGYSIGGSFLAVLTLLAIRWRQNRFSEKSLAVSQKNSGLIFKQRAEARLLRSDDELIRLEREIAIIDDAGTRSNLESELNSLRLKYRSAWGTFNQFQPGEVKTQLLDQDLPVETYRQLSEVFEELNGRLDEIETYKDALELKIPKTK